MREWLGGIASMYVLKTQHFEAGTECLGQDVCT